MNDEKLSDDVVRELHLLGLRLSGEILAEAESGASGTEESARTTTDDVRAAWSRISRPRPPDPHIIRMAGIIEFGFLTLVVAACIFFIYDLTATRLSRPERAALAIISVGFLYFIIVAAVLLQRRVAARDLKARAKREGMMRNLRWAAELAVSNDPAKARLGVRELTVLLDSGILTPVELGLIDAALSAAIEIPRLIAQSASDVEVVVETGGNVSEETLLSPEETEEEDETDI